MSNAQYGTSQSFVDVLPNTVYAGKSIVSKVPIDNDLFQLTYLAIAAGEALTEHTSPRAVVVTLLSGAVDFTVEGVVSHMHAGDSVYLAPGAPHALSAHENSCVQLVMINTPAE